MVFCLAAALLAQTAAKPFVSPMFSDNMVLQRGMADPVWGWAAPGTSVKVTIDNRTASAVAGDDGKWMTKIGPLKVGGPYTLNIDGPQSVTFNNVLVGDVWLCSGQSNMEFGVGNIADPRPVISAADHPTLRLYTVPHYIAAAPIDVNPATWTVCTPDNLQKTGLWNGFTAVGYFFGQKLNQDLNVPIGLVQTAWGGTVAEAWAAEKELGDRLPQFRGQIAQVAAQRSNTSHAAIDAQYAAWYSKNDAGDGKWSDPALDDSGWKTMNLPGMVQDAGMPEFVNRQSVFWLRRAIDLPEDTASKAVTMHLLVDDNDAVWVNGTKIGATDGYNVKRNYAIPAGILKAGSNVIAIRVTDTQSPGGVYGDPNGFSLEPSGGTPILLGGSWKVKLGGVVGQGNPFPIMFGDNPNISTVLFNGMIAPLAPFGIKGAIWYQGESNGDRGYEYRTLLPTMITSWRDTFNEGKFPFLIVQLAGWNLPPGNQPGDDNWAELREAQFLTANHLPNTGIATAIDIGDPADIHPKNKLEIGRRLALVAEAQVYRQKVVDSGPVYRGMRIEGSAIRLQFSHTEGGLKTADGGPVKGVQIAGMDHKWVWADAKIDGDSVVASSAGVPQPVAVRYAWRSFTDANLFNGENLPAFPFRTDDWKISSQH